MSMDTANSEVFVPTRYEIYAQSIKGNVLNLIYMGYNTNLKDAKMMCDILSECDRREHHGTQTRLFLLRCVVEKKEV